MSAHAHPEDGWGRLLDGSPQMGSRRAQPSGTCAKAARDHPARSRAGRGWIRPHCVRAQDAPHPRNHQRGMPYGEPALFSSFNTHDCGGSDRNGPRVRAKQSMFADHPHAPYLTHCLNNSHDAHRDSPGIGRRPNRLVFPANSVGMKIAQAPSGCNDAAAARRDAHVHRSRHTARDHHPLVAGHGASPPMMAASSRDNLNSMQSWAHLPDARLHLTA
jgi:hypothetical protein